MDLVELNKQIREGNIAPMYIFSGPEIGLQNVYINQICKGRIQKRVDNIASIIKKVTSSNNIFRDNKSKDEVYIIRDDMDFIKTEKAWHIEIKNGTIILLVTNLDKRGKFYKYYKDIIVEFEKMTTSQILQIFPKEFDIGIGLKKYFIEACQNDYNTVLNNLDKLKRLNITTINKSIIDEVVEPQEECNVFDLASYLIRKDTSEVFIELKNLLDKGENEIAILSVIYKKIKEAILVEGYRGEKNISKLTELNPWVCKDILDNNKIAPASLLRSIRIIDKYDRGIKTGRYEPKLAVEACIIEILSL